MPMPTAKKCCNEKPKSYVDKIYGDDEMSFLIICLSCRRKVVVRNEGNTLNDLEFETVSLWNSSKCYEQIEVGLLKTGGK